MKELFNKIFKMSMMSSILFLIFGIILFTNPEGVIVTISYVLGILLILIGIIQIVFYAKSNSKIFMDTTLGVGLFAFISGLILILNTTLLATIIPILIGIWMLFTGIEKFRLALNLKNNEINGWIISMILSILTLLCGFIFIINPIEGTFLVTEAIGLIIIIYSIIDIIQNLVMKNHIKQFKSETKNGIKIIEERDKK